MNIDFKVLRLSLLNNNIFEDIDVEFYDRTDHPKEPYTTLIIGPNGTGKSNLLRILILLFQEIKDFKDKGRRIAKVQGKFYLKYQFNGNIYNYFNYDIENKEIRNFITPKIECNHVPVVLYSTVEIPETIIALSNTITDKFPTDSKYENYKYLGVKANANTARTTTFIRKTVDLLYNALEDQKVYNNIAKGLKFLDYDKSLYVSYTPRYKHIIFKEGLDENTFERFFTHFWEYTKRAKESPPWSFNVFKNLKKDHPNKIPKLVRLCKKIKKSFQYEYEGSKSQYFEFDIFEGSFSAEELHLIRDLYSLDLISYPSLLFKKKNSYFDIAESSSGEYHFISGFIGLIALITENSLIVIDEPENSLHPNWQMKYISFFKNVFRHFSSCHIIIASHSHLMVSDLANDSSCIIGLKKGKTITADAIKSNTFGWSSEEILMSIFETPSNRNYYLTEQLGDIFKLISESPDKRNIPEIKKKVSNLKKLDLSGLNKEDPLKDVLDELFKRFEYA